MAGMATNIPAAVANSAAAMPGAMALTLTSPAAAIAAKVIITPTTVPSSPMNGPPEMAMVRTTIRLPSLCCSCANPVSIAAWMAVNVCGENEPPGCSRPASRRSFISATLILVNRCSPELRLARVSLAAIWLSATMWSPPEAASFSRYSAWNTRSPLASRLR